jgi:hypothetical protein
MAGDPKICDLYFRYRPSSAFGMQLGQFKIPFAIENDIYGPTTVELIDYSYITTLLARNANRFDGIAATGRDIGFQVYGGFGNNKDYKTLSYNLGIFNGTGINKNDDNNAKDIVARLIYKPSKELSVSGSVMITETNAGPATIKSNRAALGVIYDAKDFIFRSEYAGAQFDDADDYDVSTFYLLGGYKIKKDWMLVARYETLSQGNINSGIAQDRVTVGAVFKPYSFLRFQLNYSIEQSGLKNSDYRDKASGLNLMLTAIF